MWAKSLVWAQARDSESAFKLIPKNLLSGRCPWDSARLRGALVEKDETCPDGDKGRYTGDSESEQVPLQEAARWRRPGDPEALAGHPGFLPPPLLPPPSFFTSLFVQRLSPPRAQPEAR